MSIEKHNIEFSIEDIKRFSWTLSDVLCVLKGFMLARPDAEIPISLTNLRDLNIKIRGDLDI